MKGAFATNLGPKKIMLVSVTSLQPNVNIAQDVNWFGLGGFWRECFLDCSKMMFY